MTLTEPRLTRPYRSIGGELVYVCICARVREAEVRSVIHAGARDEFDVGEACGAGTGCGSCVERICGILQEGEVPLARAS